jgi:hypothetical protein
MLRVQIYRAVTALSVLTTLVVASGAGHKFG